MKTIKQIIMKTTTILIVAVMTAMLMLPEEASASHFRYGTLSWAPTGTPGQVVFSLKAAFRRSAYGTPVVGTIITETTGGTSLNFGDATATGTLRFIVTSFSATEDWIIGEALQPSTNNVGIFRTYAGAGPYLANVSSCCRIGALNNGSNGSYRLETTVTPLNGNTPPTTNQPPIITLPSSSSATYTLVGSDANNDDIRYRLATAAEKGFTGNVPGLTIDAITGVITWNNIGLNQVNPWTVQIILEDLDALGNVKSKTPVDFFLKIVTVIGTTPTCTLSEGGTFTIHCDTLSTFTITATDPDGGAVVTINVSGLPTGSSMSPSLPISGASGLSSTFTWYPTSINIGTHVIVFTITDNNNQQSQCSMVINVVGDPIVVSGPTTFCSGGSLTMTAPSGASSYLWYPNGQTTQSITVSVSDTFFVIFNGTADTSCSIITTVYPVPVITASGPLTICTGGSVVLTSSTSGPWFWNSGQTTQSITLTASGTRTVSVNGCTSAPVTFTASALPAIPVITSNAPVCPGTTLNLFSTNSAYTSWSWTGPNGFTSNVQNPSISNVPSAASGSYSLTVSNAGGCTRSGSATITLAPQPTLGNVPDISICTGGSTQLALSGSASSSTNVCIYDQSGGTGACNFTSSLCNDGYLFTNLPRTSSPFSIASASSITSIDFKIYWTSCDATVRVWNFLLNGVNIGNSGSLTSTDCSCTPVSAGTYPTTITITGAQLNANWNFSGSNTLTVAPSGTTNSYIAGYTAVVNYVGQIWSPSTGLSDPNILNPIASPSVTTQYTATVTNSYGCSAATSVLVTVVDPPSTSAAGSDQSIIGYDNATLSANTPSVGTGEWSVIIGTGTFANANNANTSVTGMTAGSNIFRWTVSNPPCADAYDEVEVFFTPCTNPTISCPANISVPASASGCSANVTWTDATVTGIPTPTITYSPANGSSFPLGTTTVTATATNVCSTATCTFTVTVTSSLAVNAGSDEQTYYGYNLDQTVNRTVTATGGGGGYTYTWSLSRQMRCNIVNSVGDEIFNSGTCTNNVCPGAPDTLTAAAPVCTNTTGSVTARLIDDANVIVTVTDAYGCTATDAFHINSLDARCFSGNSSNYKIRVCHYTGSNTNPWVEICIAQPAVPAHLALHETDYIGYCGARFDMSSSPGHIGMMVYPNPAQNQVTVEFDSPTNGTYQVQLFDITGRVVSNGNGSAQQGINKVALPINGIALGVYNLRLTVGDASSSVRLLVTE